jgi:hypothetical protein
MTYKFQVIRQSQDEMLDCNCVKQVSSHNDCRLRQALLNLVDCKNDYPTVAVKHVLHIGEAMFLIVM